jgi:peptidoglycan hydrolase-like protein with peptidoglycan-binding domain
VKTAKKTKAVKKQTSQAAKKKAIKANPQVKAAQSALVSAGYKIKADGVMGKNTKKALRAFQKKNKLKVTGKLDAATKKALAL